MTNHPQLRATAGIGLKPQHFAEVLQPEVAANWFEVHAENYLVSGGPLLQGLLRVRKQHALSLHCVGMSPGSADGIDECHVRRIKALCDLLEPALVSDHLSWSRWQQHSLNDLLPLPYTEEALGIVADNVDRIQNLLGRPIALENPSVYLALTQNDFAEAEFLVQLALTTGCRLLLDLNNLVVNATNIGLDIDGWLACIPPALVAEFHLAGHKVEQHPHGPLCIDDHGSAVPDAVWQVYATALKRFGAQPTLIEWDTAVPAFSVLQQEAAKADRLLQALPPMRQPVERRYA